MASTIYPLLCQLGGGGSDVGGGEPGREVFREPLDLCSQSICNPEGCPFHGFLYKSACDEVRSDMHHF